MKKKIICFTNSVPFAHGLKRLAELRLAEQKIQTHTALFFIADPTLFFEELQATEVTTQLIVFVGSTSPSSGISDKDFVVKIHQEKPDALIVWYSMIDPPATDKVTFFISKQAPLSTDELNTMVQLQKSDSRYQPIEWEVLQQIPFVDLLLNLLPLQDINHIRKEIGTYSHRTLSFMTEKI